MEHHKVDLMIVKDKENSKNDEEYLKIYFYILKLSVK